MVDKLGLGNDVPDLREQLRPRSDAALGKTSRHELMSTGPPALACSVRMPCCTPNRRSDRETSADPEMRPVGGDRGKLRLTLPSWESVDLAAVSPPLRPLRPCPSV